MNTNGITATHATAISLADLEKQLRAIFPERSTHVRCLVTAFAAGENVLMLGDPGTAKSLLTRTAAAGLGASYFEWLMSRFTTPEEIFGPIKLSALQADRFERAITGYAPCAQIVFLDEVFKANSAILNALLTLLNERVFHNDGKPVSSPLVTCVGASNELPEGPELDALYDRFLVRCVTEYLSDDAAFASMLTAAAPVVTGCVDIAAEQKAARAVKVGDDVVQAIVALRSAGKKDGIIASDRRWRQSLSVIRATAHVDGRSVAEPEDLEILESVLWRKPDERHAVAKLVQSVVNPAGAQAVECLDQAKDILMRLPDAGTTDAGAYMGAVGVAVKDIRQICDRLGKLPSGRKVNQAKRDVETIRAEVSKRAARAAGLNV